MPIRIVRQVTFLVSLILLAFAVAGGLAFAITYKEGGIFDSGFRQKVGLSEMKLVGDEVLEGLPSLTVTMIPEPHSIGEADPGAVLDEVGRNISRASKQDTSSDIVNVDFSTKSHSESAEVQTKFRFNASTAVDYNDDVYERTVGLLQILVDSGRYSAVSVESTPTPDGGRSVNVETTMNVTSDDNSPLEIYNAWSEMLRPMTRFVGEDGNLSSAKLVSKNVSVSADFFDEKTFEAARTMPHDIFEMVDVVANFSRSEAVMEGNFNLSAVSPEDSTLTVLLVSEVEDASFVSISDSVVDSLKRNGFADSSWTVLITVDGKPELNSVLFGT